MSNIIKLNRDVIEECDKIITIEEAAKIIGMKYNAAYNLIKYTNKITKFDYGRRNIKVSEKSVKAYRDRHRIQGEY
jgi:hypothetical protein